jgi:hypothetical protein
LESFLFIAGVKWPGRLTENIDANGLNLFGAGAYLPHKEQVHVHEMEG